MKMLIYRIKHLLFPSRIKSDEYTWFLKQNGVRIGSGTHFFDPARTIVDIQRPWLLSIGNHCKITSNVTILAHDYSSSVLRRKYGELIGEARETRIGDNVFLGMGSTVCMGSQIGDNVIIGAGSVVTGTIPSNSVAAGVPARVICSLDDYVEKRRASTMREATCYVNCFQKYYGRNPSESEMDSFWQLFTPRDIDVIRANRIKTNLSGDEETDVINDFLNSKPQFDSFEKFLEFVESNKLL